MKFFFYAFIIILTRNSFGGIAIPLAITNAEDDLWGSSPDLSLFSDHELLPGTTTNDVDLFTSATDTTDSSTLLSASINPDAFCPNQLSLETDEGVFFEPSSSEAVEARDPDDGTLDRRAGPTDLQCAQRTKPQAPKKAPNIKVPQLPSLWPQPYPEVPRGQCIDQFRTLATCCTTREGINPADCFLCKFDSFIKYGILY